MYFSHSKAGAVILFKRAALPRLPPTPFRTGVCNSRTGAVDFCTSPVPAASCGCAMGYLDRYRSKPKRTEEPSSSASATPETEVRTSQRIRELLYTKWRCPPPIAQPKARAHTVATLLPGRVLAQSTASSAVSILTKRMTASDSRILSLHPRSGCRPA